MDKKITDIKTFLINSKNNHFIADYSKFNDNEIFLDDVAKNLSKGKNFIKFKCGSLKDNDAVILGKKIRQLCSIYNALFIVESRLDIAKLTDADGVCLNAGDVDKSLAYNILDDDKLVLEG